MEATMHGDGASLFVAQRLNTNAHPPMRSPSTKPETVPPRRSATGFLLLDSSLRPIAFNPEALRVLSYPNELRSEEHTSELQSRFDLVCRLLLEKKKKNN